MAFLEKVLLIIEPTALALLLVYAYGFVSRAGRMQSYVNMIMGSIFGLCAVVAMMDPITISEGIIVDIRTLFIGAAAAFCGFAGGTIALALGVITRLSIGGEGAVLGAIGMAVATAMGWAWAVFVRPRIKSDLKSHLVLGAMLSLHLLVALMLPPVARETFFFKLAPVLLIADIAGALFLGLLIKRERILLDQQNQLKDAATFDPLTKLMNRDAAHAHYEADDTWPALSKGTAMLCIDVDHFKSINDTHGHLRGDEVLVEIAQRMRACLRPNDIFARMSGDEFVIVLNDLTADQAKAVADRCQNSISAYPMVASGVEIGMSVSVGCTWVSERPEFGTLRAAADKALYRAKEEGRDRLAFDRVARLIAGTEQLHHQVA